MKKKALAKEFFMSIKKTYNRFISICLIVMLGTAFFAGVKAAEPDMQESADIFFDDSKLMDIRVLSTLGLTEDDVTAISAIEGVESAIPVYTYDVLTEKDEKQHVIKLMSETTDMNKITVTEGRMPQESGECLADWLLEQNYGYKIGDKITISSGDDKAIEDIVNTQTYTITGFGKSSYYLDLTRDSSTIGNGSMSGFLIIPEDNFTLEAFTEIDVLVDGAIALDCYSDAYEDAVDEVTQKIKDIAGDRCEIRYAEVVREAQDAIAEAETEVSDGEQELADAKEELEDGWEQLADAKKEVAEGQMELADAKTQVSDGEKELDAAKDKVADGEKELADAKTQLADGQNQINQAKQQISDGEASIAAYNTELDNGRKQLESAAGQLADAKTGLETLKSGIEQMENALNASQTELDASGEDLKQARTELEANRGQIDGYRTLVATMDSQIAELQEKIDELQAQIDASPGDSAKINERDAKIAERDAKITQRDAMQTGIAEFDQNEALLLQNEAAYEEGKKALDAKWAELAALKKTYDSGMADYTAGMSAYEENLSELNENQAKLEDAKADIIQAKADLADIDVPEWYVLDRNYITTCVAYAQDSERIGNIGNVFPVIFFLVAALVSLTTMTRMVEEERVQIGTLKALGYRKSSIAAKYVMYAFLATMLGGTIGTLIGQIIFPAVIMNAYKIAYVTLTDFVTPIHLKYSLISMIAAVVSTTAATLAACYKELLAAPAELMRPAAPKIGKRVFLERITFIWKHLNFSNKAAVRNLFRYKKRLFMTVLGIGGCMGLLLVGFGVKDSIMTIGDRQYNFIHTYQVKMTLADADTDEEKQEVLDSVLKEPTTKAAMLSHESTIDACCGANGEKKQSTYLFIPSDADELDEFVSLQNRISGQKYTLDDEGVIISEKLATLLDVSEGDDIYLEVSSLNYKPVKVMHIAENYYYHYVYMTPECYQSLFGKDIEYDEIFVVNKDAEDISYENDFSAKYLDNNAVSGITFTRTISDRIESMITSMNIVTYVLVVSAGLLAFIVLYNLNNINISERQRELATLKVLGFYDGEISMYVFRENIMLTVLGTIFGIFFGIWLHRFVILTAELDIMMFGRQIYTKSYIFSILLTIGFSIIVNIVMHWKMKKIDMIESLKSVE